MKKQDVFTFAICTCGADCGKALKHLSKLYHLDSSYSIVMPNNYLIANKIEDLSVITKKIADAKNEVDTIASEITARKKYTAFMKVVWLH